jgi:hypothetical protein
MPTPIEAYRAGYERGRSDSAGGRLAEITMGVLRDDPGGHFQKGYSDGAAGRPFSPPPIPARVRRQTSGLIPKFSENPFGWFLGILIVVELWVLWQLIKAPFQLVGSLMRSEKPSPWVIVKNIIVAGVAIALVWWVPHVNELRGPQLSYTAAPPGSRSQSEPNNPQTNSAPAPPVAVHSLKEVKWLRTSPLLAAFGPPRGDFGIAPLQFFSQRPDISWLVFGRS